MTNTNCLAGFECPKCKSDGPFKITVQHIVLKGDACRPCQIGP